VGNMIIRLATPDESVPQTNCCAPPRVFGQTRGILAGEPTQPARWTYLTQFTVATERVGSVATGPASISIGSGRRRSGNPTVQFASRDFVYFIEICWYAAR
jgi:hypothetical protein